jgi:hypothetical protein
MIAETTDDSCLIETGYTGAKLFIFVARITPFPSQSSGTFGWNLGDLPHACAYVRNLLAKPQLKRGLKLLQLCVAKHLVLHSTLFSSKAFVLSLVFLIQPIAI